MIRLESAAIVLAGQLNPAIFHPSWFGQHRLLGDEEVEFAKQNVQMVGAEFASWQTDWLQLQVTRERFVAHTTDNSRFEPLRDLAHGTFQLLEHTPANLVGVLRLLHFDVGGPDALAKILGQFVPRSIWDRVMPGAQARSAQSFSDSNTARRVYLKIEPSFRVPDTLYTEYTAELKTERTPPARVLIEEAASIFAEVMKSAEDIANKLRAFADD